MNAPTDWLPLADLFDCVADVLAWVKDCEGRYRWVNRAFLLNYTCNAPADPAGEILGKTDYDLSPAWLADQFRIDDEQVLAGHRIVDRIELVGQPDGHAVWNLTNKIPLLDATGAVVGTAGLTRNLPATGPPSPRDAAFGSVLAFLRDNYGTPISNRHLARLAHMSVRSFERKFLAVFGLTPQKYLRKLRLRLASRALVSTRDSIADVAARCGFADQSHFTREFRRHFGRTPRLYREHYAPGAGLAAPVPKPAADAQAPPVPSGLNSPR